MKIRKGNLTGVIPMLLLLLTSSLFAVQSITVANAMADEVIDSVENLGKVVEGSSSSGRYFYDYLTKAASYSINQKTYDLAQDGGGVKWTSQDLELLTTTQMILHNRANEYYEENYVTKDISGERCQFDNRGFNILLPSPNNQADLNSVHIAGSVVSNFKEVKTNCQFDDSRLQQHATEGFYRAKYNSSFNRYFQLTDETISFYKDLRTRWQSTSTTFTVSSDQCGSYNSEEDVEDQAVDQAYNVYENRLQDVAADYPKMSGADFEASVNDIEYEVLDVTKSTGDCCNEGTPECLDGFAGKEQGDGSSGDEDTGDSNGGEVISWNGHNRTIKAVSNFFGIGDDSSEDGVTENRIQAAYLKKTQSGECGPDCDLCGPTPCLENTRTTEVTIEVNEVHASSTLTDERYNILLEDGWDNLEFSVSDYTHHTTEPDSSETFQVPLGESANIPDSSNNIKLFSATGNDVKRLYFRMSGDSSTSCKDNVLRGSPISNSNIDSSTSKCGVGGAVDTSSGQKSIGVCNYDESDEKATLVVFEGEASTSEMIDGCNSDTSEAGETGGVIEGSRGGFGLGQELYGQSAQVKHGLVKPDATTENLQKWLEDRKRIYEDSIFDITTFNSEETTEDGSEKSETRNEGSTGSYPGAVGGGSEYVSQLSDTEKITQSDATTTVSTASGLKNEVESASSGDVIWVDGNSEIEMSGEGIIEVGSGVTVASNRGQGGEGATIIDDEPNEDEPIFRLKGSDSRITGLKLIGFGDSSQPHDRDRTRGMGIEVEADNVEIDNNYIDNFVGRCVSISGNDAHVHHNSITYCNKLGYGYLVVTVGENTLIESNYFNHYRHAIASNGGEDMSWTARYNVVGPDRQNHDFDVHGDSCGGDCGTAGNYVEIYENTFQGEKTYTDTGQPHVDIRGMPATDSVIRDNWFEGLDYDKYSPIVIEEEGFSGDETEGTITMENNHLGTDKPSCDVGAPREECATQDTSSDTGDSSSGSEDVSLETCNIPKNTLVESKFENGPMQPFNDGDETYLSTVSSGSYEGDSLRVEIQAGNHYGFGGGHIFSQAGQSEPEELFAQYMLKFGDNWDPGGGWSGKLPGFAGTYGESGWGGRIPSGDDGWSARGAFTNDGNGNTDVGFYNYHMGIDKWGDIYADGSLENGQWYCVKQHIRLNTPGENDGVLEAWVDGEKVADRKDIRWRDTKKLKIEEYWFDIYFGGSATPDESQSVYFDNFAVTKDESIIQ